MNNLKRINLEGQEYFYKTGINTFTNAGSYTDFYKEVTVTRKRYIFFGPEVQVKMKVFVFYIGLDIEHATKEEAKLAIDRINSVQKAFNNTI